MTPRQTMRTLAALVYPRRCPFCDRVLGAVSDCPHCAAELERLRLAVPRLSEGEHLMYSLSGAAAAWRYSDCVRSALLRFKDGGRACYGAELGARMARELFGCNFIVQHGIINFNGTPPLARFDLVIPVPASDRSRGYNPAELLARPLAEALGIPLRTDVLRKKHLTHTQKGLSAQERMRNLRGAFEVCDFDAADGRRVLLVDDVITTGATVSSCAETLMRAGALDVFAAAAAETQL